MDMKYVTLSCVPD